MSDVARARKLPDPGRLAALLAELEPHLPEFADWALAYILDPHGRVARVNGTHATPDGNKLVAGIAAYYRNPRALEALAAPGFHPARAVLEGAPITLYQLRGWQPEPGSPQEAHLRLIQALGLASAATAPLLANEHLYGALVFGRAEDRDPFRAVDVGTARRLASETKL